MTPPALHIQQHVGKLLMSGLPPVTTMVNLPVLAEDTQQVTVREKYRS
jgi:hypothetical protein